MSDVKRGAFGLRNKEAWWEDPPPPPDGGRRGPNPVGWPILALMFLLPYLIPATRGLVADDGSLGSRVVTAVLLYGYAAFYLVFPWTFGRPLRTRLIFCASNLLLAMICLVVTDTTPYILLYGTATVAFVVPAAWCLILDVGTLLVATGFLLVAGRLSNSIGDLSSVLSVTSAMFFMANLVRVIRRLERANGEIATLAVTDERQRMARDLHDLLGHSLTTITVKAGLTRRVLESSGDIPRAVEELREVEALSRSALSDVRATVSEYREVSLSAEVVGARAALRAAEIDMDLPHAVDNVKPEYQNTFGYVLRETVTNVLRHSGASKVKVRLGRNWLEIEDDGKAGISGAEPQTPAGGTPPGPPTAGGIVQGNGLRGLTERLDLIGGTLRTSVRSGGGLVVRAEVPQPAETSAAPVELGRAEPAGGLA